MAFEVRSAACSPVKRACGRRARRVRRQARRRRQIAREHRRRRRAVQAHRRRSDHGDRHRTRAARCSSRPLSSKATRRRPRRRSSPTRRRFTYKRSDDPDAAQLQDQLRHADRARHALGDGADPRLAPAPGTTRSVFVVGGRRLWRVDVTYIGNETIGSELGNRATVEFEGASFRASRELHSRDASKPARTFTVWLSDDADRVLSRSSRTPSSAISPST